MRHVPQIIVNAGLGNIKGLLALHVITNHKKVVKNNRQDGRAQY